MEYESQRPLQALTCSPPLTRTTPAYSVENWNEEVRGESHKKTALSVCNVTLQTLFICESKVRGHSVYDMVNDLTHNREKRGEKRDMSHNHSREFFSCRIRKKGA